MNTSNELTLQDVLSVIHRRRQVMVWTIAATVALALLVCIFMTRRYTAVGVVQLNKVANSLGLDSLIGTAAEDSSDALSVNIDLQTQADILKSDSLALRVIQDLQLENTEDFHPRFNPIGWALGLLSPKPISDPVAASLEDAPLRRHRLLEIFRNNLKVKVTAGTRLLEIDYVSRDPKTAAAVVNELVKDLIDYTFQTRLNGTSESSRWLQSQLGDLRDQSEQLQARVVALQQSGGIVGIGLTDPTGKPVIYSPILDRLQQSSLALSQAQINRVVKGSVFEIAKTGSPELISQLSGTSMGGGSNPGVNNSLSLIQTLRAQEANLTAQIAQDSSQFGSAYPRLIQEHASLAGVQQSIQQEVARIAARARNDFEVAARTETGAREEYEADQAAADRLNNKSIEYGLLSKEANQSEQLYQDLLKKLKEAGVMEGLRSSNITIVDKARPPATPSNPRVPLYLALALVLGGVLSGCTAFIAEATDNKIRWVEQIDGMGLPLIAAIPKIKRRDLPEGPILPNEGHSAFDESIRELRATLRVAHDASPLQILLVTSVGPEEGKSTIATNLAISLIQRHNKVLLVQADMRRPLLAGRLSLPASSGLSGVLSEAAPGPAFVTLEKYPNLSILPAGAASIHSAELLGSARMSSLVTEWRKTFDYVVIDSPPVLPVTDSRLIHELADATVLVARNGATTRKQLIRAYKLLLKHRTAARNTAIGIALNFVSLNRAEHYEYYGETEHQLAVHGDSI